MEHRGDTSDQASAIEERTLRQALQAQAQKAQLATPSEFDGLHCVECDVEILQGRLALGKFTCVECQTAIEKLSKQRRQP